VAADRPASHFFKDIEQKSVKMTGGQELSSFSNPSFLMIKSFDFSDRASHHQKGMVQGRHLHFPVSFLVQLYLRSH
jgi:hypothetical protein